MSVIKYAVDFYWQNYKKFTLLKIKQTKTKSQNPQQQKQTNKNQANPPQTLNSSNKQKI